MISFFFFIFLPCFKITLCQLLLLQVPNLHSRAFGEVCETIEGLDGVVCLIVKNGGARQPVRVFAPTAPLAAAERAIMSQNDDAALDEVCRCFFLRQFLLNHAVGRRLRNSSEPPCKSTKPTARCAHRTQRLPLSTISTCCPSSTGLI
jgi:hypothetical protein